MKEKKEEPELLRSKEKGKRRERKNELEAKEASRKGRERIKGEEDVCESFGK